MIRITSQLALIQSKLTEIMNSLGEIIHHRDSIDAVREKTIFWRRESVDSPSTSTGAAVPVRPGRRRHPDGGDRQIGRRLPAPREGDTVTVTFRRSSASNVSSHVNRTTEAGIRFGKSALRCWDNVKYGRSVDAPRTSTANWCRFRHLISLNFRLRYFL